LFKTILISSVIAALSGSLLGCAPAANKQTSSRELTQIDASRDLLQTAAGNIKIKIRIDDNDWRQDCANNASTCYKGTLFIDFNSVMPQDWRIVFSHLSPINKVISDEFTLKHLNGDMHQITSKVSTLETKKTYKIEFFGNTPLVSESVLFPNYLLIDQNNQAVVIASTTETLGAGDQLPRPQHIMAFADNAQLIRGENDNVKLASAEERFSRFARASNTELASTDPVPKTAPRIIPKLQNALWSGLQVTVDKGIDLSALTTTQSDIGLTSIRQRFAKIGLKLTDNGLKLTATASNLLPPEAYTLQISDDSIYIEHSNEAGLYYALISIAQLYDQANMALPIGKVEDQPSMPFRGLHIDVSRNFRTKEFILSTLDQMAYYKLNKLHLHLADDEGWRLQIESLPELTDVGAHRCFDPTETRCLEPQLASGNVSTNNAKDNNDGYYSVEDYLDILRYANARHIEVIPSLDMPGHSRAAIVSMNARYQRLMAAGEPEKATEFYLTEPADKSEYRSIQHYNDNTLNPCIASTYRFIDEVLGQLIQMHKAAGVPLKRYHIGADETAGAWKDSPACQQLLSENSTLESVAALGPYFIEKVAQSVSNLDIIPAAWSDGLSHANADNLPANIHSNVWGTLYSGAHNEIHKMINYGWDVILSLPDVLYFDFPYEADPVEPGYYWGSRFTDTYQVFQLMPFNLPAHAELWTDNFGNEYVAKADIDLAPNKQILGIQAQLWSETVRSDAQANYMLFPRLLATAERAWHAPSWAETYQTSRDYSQSSQHIDADQLQALDQNWQSFSLALSTQAMPQLIKDGIVPRVPLPGAKIKNNRLYMRPAFAGLVSQYKIDDQSWQNYIAPVQLQSAESLRVRASVVGTDLNSREQALDFDPIQSAQQRGQ